MADAAPERQAAVGAADGRWVASHVGDEGGWVEADDGTVLSPIDPEGAVLTARGDAVHVALPSLGAVWQRVCP